MRRFNKRRSEAKPNLKWLWEQATQTGPAEPVSGGAVAGAPVDSNAASTGGNNTSGQKLPGFENVPAPQGTDYSNERFNLANGDPMEVLAQLVSGDPNQPIYKNPGFKKKPEAVKAWLTGTIKNADTFIQRYDSIKAKVKGVNTGLSKKEMPSLEPENVETVIDAFSPGGQYNVDLVEKIEPPAPGKLTKGPEGDKYLTSGFNDGDPDDDNVSVVKGGKITASEAIPTQTDILLGKSLGMAVGGLTGGDLGAYITTSKEILDGHHRWASTVFNDPTATLGGAATVDTEKLGTLPTLKYLTGVGNAIGNMQKESLIREAMFSSDRFQILAGIKKRY